jgi:NadR type nicotinamide-nucleotide adenylyltransferase
MEKEVDAARESVARVILTGPESTGKTELTSALAGRYHTEYIPEYARMFIEKLDRPYRYGDLVHIAKHQAQQMQEYSSKKLRVLFIDTYLIITKIWFLWVYKRYPGWLDDEIKKTKNDLYLLCNPDIPWFPDGVRENGGEMRNKLFVAYENELIKNNLHYKYVLGQGAERIRNAAEQVADFLKQTGIVV